MGLLKRFLRNSGGNVGMMLALSIIPIIIAAGAGVDMVRANNSQTLLQGAADAAALAGGTSSTITEAELNQIVTNYVTVNGGVKALDEVRVLEWHNDKVNRTFQVKVGGRLETTLMKLAGINTMDLGALAEVNLGANGLEVALVLDNTGSMNEGTRLPTLKSSAKMLVNQVLDASNSSYTRVGVVPFSEYVNVGTANRGAPWLSVPSDSSTTTNVCSDTYPDAVATNCHDETGVTYDDGIAKNYTYQVCDWNYGTPVSVCRDITSNKTWAGCVGSRSTTLDTRIDDPSVPYEGLQNVLYCPAPLMTLSSDKATLNSNIDAMYGSGNTYIPAGLLWGWNLLNPAEPFTEAKSKTWMRDNGGTKALVLMTDGDNTLSADYPYHWGTNVALANSKVTALCDAIKADGIVVYTVSLSVTNAVSKNMLADCASDGKKAFAAEDSAELAAAFKEITESLLALRLSK